MELSDYRRIIRSQWLAIISFVLVFVAVAAVVSLAIPKNYQSSAQVFISSAQGPGNDNDPSDNAYNGGLAATQRASSYAALAMQTSVLAKVIDRLNLDTTADELSQNVSASTDPATSLIRIDVTDSSPRQAQRICGAVVGVLRSTIRVLETPSGQADSLIRTAVTDPPDYPDDASSPRLLRNLGVAAVLGAIVGLGAAYVRDSRDNALATSDDIRRAIDRPVLGALSIPASGRPVDYKMFTDDSENIEELRILVANLRSLSTDMPVRTITISSAVDDCARSEVAVSMAAAMAQGGSRVLLLDADMRARTASDLLGLDQSAGLADVLAGRASVSSNSTHPTGISVMPAGNTSADSVALLQSSQMQEFLLTASTSFDFVVIDAPPVLAVSDAAVIAARVDGFLLVATQGRATTAQLRESGDRLSSAGGRLLGAIAVKPASRGDNKQRRTRSRDGMPTRSR